MTHAIDQRVKRVTELAARAGASQLQQHAFEMRGKGWSARFFWRIRRPWQGWPASDADGSPPLVEHVEHVRVAEVDLDGPPSWALPVVPFEAAIDTGVRDLQRDTLRRPPGHEIERGPGHANQMAVVLP